MTPPAPMLMHVTITSVVVTFWGAIIFGGWPFKAIIKNEVAAGLTLLTGCYVVNYIFFRIFFDYGFMEGAPVYVASLDPHGMFSALNILVFEVSFLIGLFTMANFDLWPLTMFPGVMRQPLLGIVWTALAIGIGGLAFWFGSGVPSREVFSTLSVATSMGSTRKA